MVPGYKNVFESVCEKQIHATRLLKCVICLLEESRAPCYQLTLHSKMDKLLTRFDLIFTIFEHFMKIGDKGNYKKKVSDELFLINILKYRHYQLTWIILDVIGICRVFIKWVQTCIKFKKLDTLIQIMLRISRILQSENHKKYYKNK